MSQSLDKKERPISLIIQMEHLISNKDTSFSDGQGATYFVKAMISFLFFSFFCYFSHSVFLIVL